MTFTVLQCGKSSMLHNLANCLCDFFLGKQLISIIHFIKLNYDTNMLINKNEMKTSVGLLKHEIKLAPWSNTWAHNS